VAFRRTSKERYPNFLDSHVFVRKCNNQDIGKLPSEPIQPKKPAKRQPSGGQNKPKQILQAKNTNTH
jgi:hypothetical protein